MTGKYNWTEFNRFIEDKKEILITTHVHPDGDAIGSEIALAIYLEQLGKKVVILNSDPMPGYFKFLDPKNQVITFKGDEHHDLIKQCDAAVSVDISEWRRLGKVGEIIQQINLAMACIDHHIASEKFVDVFISDSHASSTGELIYDLVLQNNGEFTPQLLNALYTCILTDTGSFRFSNTTPHTHKIISDLIARNVDFIGVYKHVYESYSFGRTKLIGSVLSNLQQDCNGRLVWFVLSNKMIADAGIEFWETESFSELTRNIKDVEVSLMFTEVDRGTKVSLRSKGQVEVNTLAKSFGGGGHKFASGATIPKPLDNVVEDVVMAAKKLFQ